MTAQTSKMMTLSVFGVGQLFRMAAEGRGQKGRAEILGVVIFSSNGSECEACELDSYSAQVIMPKGVSKGTNTSRCHPLSVSVTSRHTELYYRLVPSLFCA